MDFSYAGGSLSVKIADLKKIESQLHNLGDKTNDDIVGFLNHLQIGGTVEAKDFSSLITNSEKFLFKQLVSLLDDTHDYLLDFVYADEILTFLNLKLNKVTYESKFQSFDHLHLSLLTLLEKELPGHQVHYLKLLSDVEKEVKNRGREQEARMTRKYYDYLSSYLSAHPFLIAKITMINLRTLYRARRLDFSLESFKDELIGDDVTREKFANLYRLDDRQIVSALRDKFDVKASATYEAMIDDPQAIDKHLDDYLYHKVKDLVFSIQFVDLFMLYAYQYRRVIKLLKKIYYRVEEYETNRHH
ncbi:MAG TPA: hypothetical protein VJZ48_01210 [Bacilli bacterium]|nr:hypothetical protein [Bacilli bacterium]